MMPERLTCCVCGGPHHALDCALARQYMAECLKPGISPVADRPLHRHDRGILPVIESEPSREEPAQHAARVAQRAYHHRWIMERPRY
jgi:hypothetical protein